MNDITKIAPYDIEAEKAALGASLLSNEAFELLEGKLAPDDFYDKVNKLIFIKLREFHKKNPQFSVDAINFRNFLEADGQLESCGGVEYLTRLMEDSPTTVNAESYIDIVKEKSVRRQFAVLAETAHANAYDLSSDVLVSIDTMEKRLFDLYTSGTKGSEYVNIADTVQNFEYDITELIEKGVVKKGIMTGFDVIDSRTNGFRPGQFIIISGRTGTGKTAFAISAIMNMVKGEFVEKGVDANGEYYENHKVLHPMFFSYEMDLREIFYRILSGQSMVPHDKILNNDIKKGSDEYERMKEAFGYLSEKDIFFVPAIGMNLSDIKAKIKKAKKEGVDIVFIDYIGLIDSRELDSRTPSFERFAYISRNLKKLARDENLPIVALSQLNREAEKDTPTLANLSGSSAIEQDADTVIILTDPQRTVNAQQNKLSVKTESGGDETGDDSEGAVEEIERAHRNYTGRSKKITAIVSKQRNGRTGAGNICFMEDIVTFCNYEKKS